jgi:hypothetical protein
MKRRSFHFAGHRECYVCRRIIGPLALVTCQPVPAPLPLDDPRVCAAFGPYRVFVHDECLPAFHEQVPSLR